MLVPIVYPEIICLIFIGSYIIEKPHQVKPNLDFDVFETLV